MKTLCQAVVLSALVGLLALAPAPKARADVVIDLDTYAAVAYSPSTGQYGYAWNFYSRSAAERVALVHCKADDARIVGWVQGGWLVLMIGDNNAYGVGYTYGAGAANTDALETAREECLQRAKKVKVVVCLCSGDYPPEVIE
jgi:hypothetical protein